MTNNNKQHCKTFFYLYLFVFLSKMVVGNDNRASHRSVNSVLTAVRNSTFKSLGTKTSTPLLTTTNNSCNCSFSSVRPVQMVSQPCVDCKKSVLTTVVPPVNILTDEELQQMRIEEIKQQLLRKLRMKGPPNVTITRNMVPLPIMHWDFSLKSTDNVNKDLDDFYAKTEQVIIMAENKHPSCPTHFHDPAGCFSFKLTEDSMKREITSAELWVFKLRDDRDQYNQTYYVSEFVKDNHINRKRTNTVAIRDTSLKDGWLKFDVTATVRRWIMKSNSNSSAHTLEVSCKTCAMDQEKSPVSNDPGEQPFIVINLGHKNDQKRNKRSLKCEPETVTCCVESLYINFTDISWNDWIYKPDGYYANYCKGSCLQDITLGMAKHTNVIQKFVLKNKRTLSPTELANLTPCCTSTRTSSLSILYYNMDNQIVHDNIPNMTVDSCGCN